MSYSNKTELLAILQHHGLQAQKSLSQNFLIDRHVLQKIIDTAELNHDDFVVEVGPGLGVLTKELLAHAGKVHAIELDRQLAPILKNQFEHHQHFSLEQGNALKAILPSTPYKVVANLPYAITSPLISYFLQPRGTEEKRPTCLVVMIQKEVAEKMCAIAPNHSILSLQVQIFGKPHIVSKVGKSAFFPQPNVDSAIIRIDVYDQPLIHNTSLFFKLIKKAFAGKRKTLLNTLEGLELENSMKIDKQILARIFTHSGIALTARPQELTIDHWREIIEGVNTKHLLNFP